MSSNQNLPSHLRRWEETESRKIDTRRIETSMYSKTILLYIFLRQHDKSTEDVLLLLIQR